MRRVLTLLLAIQVVGMDARAKVDLGIPKGECRIPAERRGNTDWFSAAEWGVFVHFLWDCQCVGKRSARIATHQSWDECVSNFDTERFASDITETGAKYVIFTMMQRTRYIVAPNETYNRLTGYEAGEACSSRDLVADLIKSLNQRDIKLMLYWTGDGPRQDAQASKGLGGWNGKVTDQYVQNWADVAAEYGERYGKDVHGWWVDGCYEHIGYNQKRWSILAKGLRAGNPKRIIALNNPTMHHANSSTLEDDYTTGENNRFGEVPTSRWVDGVQWHTLSFLGKQWCDKGVRYSSDWLANYVYNCNRVGGVVSIDVLLYSNGSIDCAHIDTLKGITPRYEELKNRKPIPVGNLACYKPSRLLNLAGTKGLVTCRDRVPSQGTDGNLETFAQAGGEYPWTYEVDLQDGVAAINRIVVSFDKNAYATHFEIVLSGDGKGWQSVAEKIDHNGTRIEVKFDAAKARYVRVLGKRPSGPNQKGGQMAIGELEVYALP